MIGLSSYPLLRLLLLVCLGTLLAFPARTQTVALKRVIFFHIDALSWDAPERLQMSHWLTLARSSTRVDEALVLLPWHQTDNGYRALSLTSPPNPTTLAGSLFLAPWWQQRYLQHAFQGRSGSAHLANSTAYRSLNPGIDHVRLGRGDDESVIRAAVEVLRNEDIGFMQLVLQDSNTHASQAVAMSSLQGGPRRGDIYAADSPYPARVRNADRLLGMVVAQLQQMGKFDDTLWVLLSDANARSGWHPIHDRDSWRIPLAFVGPGVRRGGRVDYAESIDIVPTVLALTGLPPLNRDGGSGRILESVRIGDIGAASAHPQRLRTINEQILRHIRLRAWSQLQSAEFPLLDVGLMQSENRPLRPGCLFWNLERMDQWPEAGSLATMIAQNDCAIGFLQQRLAASGAPPLPATPARPP